MKLQKVNLKSVAAKAGVSLTAASYALRPGPRPPFVSEATQKRVLEVADKMGFRVHAAARSLRSNKRYSIAIVCGRLRDRSAITAAESIIAYLSSTSYVGVVTTCSQVDNLREYILRLMDSRSHDALIFIRDDHMITAGLLKYLVSAGIRAAAIMPKRDQLPRMPLAYLNRPRAAALLVEVLASQGHRHIDYILPQSAPADIIEQAVAAAEKLRVRLRMVPVIVESDDVNEFRIGVEIVHSHLLKSKASAVAVLYENLALGVVQGLSMCGIKVPEQRSVLAYGSVAVFEANEPPISAISHPIEEIGRTIARSTIAWIEAGFSPQAVQISPFVPEYFPRSTVRDIS